MLLRPDEVTNLKKGREILIELREGEVRVLKRNFCGVYEFFSQEDKRAVEYFEDLNLFKNRYGNIHKKFPLTNLSRQRLDIYPLTEAMNKRQLLKWFSEYGKIIYQRTKVFDDIEIEYYCWVSATENTSTNFQILNTSDGLTLNISPKNIMKNIPIAV